MRTRVIIQGNGLMHTPICHLLRRERTLDAILGFEGAEDPFGQGIVIRIADAAHAGQQLALLKGLLIGPSGILDAVVRVMHATELRSLSEAARPHGGPAPG